MSDGKMSDGKLLTERRGGVLVLTLNRPEVRNAIDTETAWAVSHALDALEADPTLAAAVLTGAGGTSWSPRRTPGSACPRSSGAWSRPAAGCCACPGASRLRWRWSGRSPASSCPPRRPSGPAW